MKKQKVNYWMISTIILFVLLVITSVLYISSLKKENGEQTTKIISQVSSSPIPTEEKQLYQLKYGKEIENTLINIFSDKVIYDKKIDTVSYFQKEFDFSTDNQEEWQHLNITSYVYKEGNSTFNDAYEGAKWTINLDDVVESFLSLKEGVQIAQVYDTTAAYEKAEVTLSRFGKRSWAVYDTYFKPGGNWVRHYVTYDTENRKLVFMTFSFVNFKDYETQKTEYVYNEEENYFTQVKYPEEISSIIKELEIILSLN